MRCSRLLVMVALVASAVVDGPAVAAPTGPRGKPPRDVAARVEALIRKNSGNVEIVTFADPRRAPVRVVRGGNARLPSAGAADVVTFSDQSLRVRSRAAERATAAIPPAIPVRPPGAGTVEIVAFADRGEQPVTVLRGSSAAAIDPDLSAAGASDTLDLFGAARGADLDRVAFAVDGAESSHGADPAMWRPELDGPQGPMQVSAAAAVDSGGGDRFDLIQNRRLGRAYLAHLYRRYGNWPDAIAAYNWGPGNMDAWIGSGRPLIGLPLEVERYRDRVLRDGGMQRASIEAISATSVRIAGK